MSVALSDEFVVTSLYMMACFHGVCVVITLTTRRPYMPGFTSDLFKWEKLNTFTQVVH